MKEFLKSGATGRDSSKRLFGTICISTGIFLLILGALLAMIVEFKDPELFKYCVSTLMIIGGALLGIGVFDGIGLKIGGK